MNKLLIAATIFKLACTPALAAMADCSDAETFTPCGPTQTLSRGLVPPRGEHGALIEAVGGEWLLRVATETRSVPSSTVKRVLDERVAAITAETGRTPKGKRLAELKAEVVHELLPHGICKRSEVPVWISPRAGLVVIGSTSGAAVDAIVTMLVKLGVTLSPLQTQLAPATGMANWLLQKAGPCGFSIDRECELKQPDVEKATVRYLRHTLELDEIGQHVRQGKLPTKLALTWQGRVSFLLIEGVNGALALKKVVLLDVTPPAAEEAADAFDGAWALQTGELGQLIVDLVDALGGLAEHARG